MSRSAIAILVALLLYGWRLYASGSSAGSAVFCHRRPRDRRLRRRAGGRSGSALKWFSDRRSADFEDRQLRTVSFRAAATRRLRRSSGVHGNVGVNAPGPHAYSGDNRDDRSHTGCCACCRESRRSRYRSAHRRSGRRPFCHYPRRTTASAYPDGPSHRLCSPNRSSSGCDREYRFRRSGWRKRHLCRRRRCHRRRRGDNLWLPVASNWLQEAQVSALGSDVRFGDSTGVSANFLLRSGGNRFSGLGRSLDDGREVDRAEPAECQPAADRDVVGCERTTGWTGAEGSALVLQRSRVSPGRRSSARVLRARRTIGTDAPVPGEADGGPGGRVASRRVRSGEQLGSRTPSMSVAPRRSTSRAICRARIRRGTPARCGR